MKRVPSKTKLRKERITKETADGINANNCTTVFNTVTGAADEDYGKFYGTTEGSYAGSYTLGQWLFSKFVGFFDYIAGILTRDLKYTYM